MRGAMLVRLRVALAPGRALEALAKRQSTLYHTVAIQEMCAHAWLYCKVWWHASTCITRVKCSLPLETQKNGYIVFKWIDWG